MWRGDEMNPVSSEEEKKTLSNKISNVKNINTDN
jgi:hypothetical protein